MSQFNETGHKAFENGASAIERYLRVKLSSGVLALAGIADKELGVASRRIAANEFGDVHLRTAPGSVPMVAAAAIAAGAPVFTAANGKVSVSAATAFLVGTALEAAAADGDIIEVLRNSHGDTAAV